MLMWEAVGPLPRVAVLLPLLVRRWLVGSRGARTPRVAVLLSVLEGRALPLWHKSRARTREMGPRSPPHPSGILTPPRRNNKPWKPTRRPCLPWARTLGLGTAPNRRGRMNHPLRMPVLLALLGAVAKASRNQASLAWPRRPQGRRRELGTLRGGRRLLPVSGRWAFRC